jgi:hypothetical protein
MSALFWIGLITVGIGLITFGFAAGVDYALNIFTGGMNEPHEGVPL